MPVQQNKTNASCPLARLRTKSKAKTHFQKRGHTHHEPHTLTDRERKRKTSIQVFFCSKNNKKTTTSTSTRRCITHTVGMYRRPNLVWLDYGYTMAMAPQLMGDCNQLCVRIASICIRVCVLITNTSSFRLARNKHHFLFGLCSRISGFSFSIDVRLCVGRLLMGRLGKWTTNAMKEWTGDTNEWKIAKRNMWMPSVNFGRVSILLFKKITNWHCCWLNIENTSTKCE